MENKPQDRFVELPNGIFVNLDNIVHIGAIYEKHTKEKDFSKSFFHKPEWIKVYIEFGFEICYKDAEEPRFISQKIDHENVKSFDAQDFDEEIDLKLKDLEAAKKLITDKLNLV